MRRAPILLAALLISGCAGVHSTQVGGPMPLPAPPRSPVNLVADDYKGRFRVAATVLENADHGPQLCQAVATSLPPQCGGPDLAGWKWDGLAAESMNGVRWGNYVLTGTFDGKVFTVTEPAKVNDGSFKTNERVTDFTSPCPAPAGGWKPVDAAKATDDAMNTANGMVTADPDFGGLWIDDSPPPDMATPANDPKRLVLNVRFTKDLARHETEIRKVWGGALCVSQAKRSEADLRRIQDELSGPDISYASTDVVSGTVEIGVYVARAGRLRELDAKYGAGVVNLIGTLQPID